MPKSNSNIHATNQAKRNSEQSNQRQLSKPPADLKVKYPTLSLEERLSLLPNILQQNNLNDYSELLGNEQELEQSVAFQKVFKPIENFIQQEKWDRTSLGIFKTYLKGGLNIHYAMKIYFSLQKSPVTSPLLMLQAYEAIQRLEIPSECQEIHQELVDNFTKVPIDQINKQINETANQFETYQAQLVEIMKPLKQQPQIVQAQIIIPDTALDQYLNGFDEYFIKYRAFQMAKEALFKKDIIGASQLIRSMMNQIVGQHSEERKFCEFYAQIIKALPEFQLVLSDDQVFCTFAPLNLKNSVSQLFQQLKIHLRCAIQQSTGLEEQKRDPISIMHQDGQVYNVIPGKLEEIFFEDARFNEMLLWYLTAQTDYTLVIKPYLQNIKPLKTIQQEHLEKVFCQIESKARGPQGIAEFMAVDIDMDLQALQKDIANWYLKKQILNWKTMTFVLYDLIKKRCSFQKFITDLMQDGSVDILFTQQFFLSCLLNNSDTYLRTMILMACSFFMPLPLVSYQPKQLRKIFNQLQSYGSENGNSIITQSESINDKTPGKDIPFVEPKNEFLPYVYEELFYCFEKHMAVLAFKVSANPNKSPQGCTSLTNYVFNRTFQTYSKSFVNYGTIEIQFDYNFEHPMFVPVADAHGLVEEEILEQVYPMFNVFLIHSFIGAEHQAIVKSQITKIHQKTKNPLIFLIIHDEGRRDNSFTSSQDGKIIKIMISRYSDLLDIPKAKLRNKIVQHFLEHIGQFKNYEANIPARLNSLKEFSDFARGFRQYRKKFMESEEEKMEDRGLHDQMQLMEALDISRTFLKMIDENKDWLRSNKVLTMNSLFEEACRLEKIMIRDTSLKNEICEQHRLKVEQLYQEMKNSKPSPLTQELRKIINHQNYLGLTSIISKLIKSFLISNLQPVLKERENLRTRAQQADLKLDEKDAIFKKIKEITEKLEKNWYSNEFLYREHYISEHSKLRGSEKPPAQSFTDYLSLANLQISQGQPFEIIDGNNLQFIKDVYQRIEADRMQEEEILVVSVIGPQSSGKSLLLNTLFGAQFLTSAGRCTRGIYGCLIDIKCDIKQTPFKKILILDSEGIQSTEALDEAFDKRVVFYILCVSHIVLICNKGEMNKSMEDTIKLATDCIMQVRENIDQQPQVNIIMNNVQINQHSLFQTIQNLSNSILEMKRHEKLRQIFTIDESNVFLLPNAFAQSGNEEFVAHQPSYQFAQNVDQLRKRILTYIQCSTKEQTASYTLNSWFQFAQKFWEFTDGYVGLTEYSTLEERKEDILLFEFTKKLIAENFEDPVRVAKHEQMIHQGVTQVLKQHKGFDQTNINVIKQKIDNVLLPRNREVEQRIQEEFRKFIDEKGIRHHIKRRRIDQLDTQIRQHFFNWQQLVQKLLGEFNQKKSKFIGDKSLQNAIDRYIQANHDKFTPLEAKTIFETEWKIIENEIEKQLKSKQQVYEEQFQDIGQLYRANARQITNIDLERALIKSYQDLDSKVLRNFLRYQKSFFFFNMKTIKPSIEQFREQIAKKKYFLQNKLEYFEINNSQEHYDWKKVIQERFKFDEYERTLIELSQKHDQSFFSSAKRKGISETQVAIIITQIREEARHFNVDISDQFEGLLQNLEKSEIQAYIIEQKKKSKKDLSIKDENICVAEVIRKYVQRIKNEIRLFFKYKSGNHRHNNPTQMKFFDTQTIRDYKISGVIEKREQFYNSRYNIILDPQDSRNQTGDGLEPINKRQTYLKIKRELRSQDQYFSQYLEYLIQSDKCHLVSATKPVETALSTFFSLINHDKLLSSIQSIVLENIFRNSRENKYRTVEDLVQDLIKSKDPNITQKFCAMDFKTIQRVVVRIEGIISKINEDMEPYSFIVSEQGSSSVHQIAQTYIIRIMQEVIKLTEHAPLLTFMQTKNVQRDLFVAKLTSNDKEMDLKLAERTGRNLGQIIIKLLKDEQILAFQDKIAAEQNLFKLNTIIKNIENQVIQVADGLLPNPFQIEIQSSGSRIAKMVGIQEEEKKSDLNDQKSKFKNLDVKLEFSPEEIIMFYVQPSEFLKKKFNDQWTKVTDVEIKNAQKKFADRINQINLNVQNYFKCFQRHIHQKKIQLATNLFIPQGQDQLSSQDIAQQEFKIQCQKATAIYLGQVLIKQWKVGTAISVDDQVKMIVPENLSLVTHEDISIELLQPFAGILQQSIQNELISNIDNFIESLMIEISISIDIEMQGTNSNALQENELIGNLYQVMKTKTLGCDQMCPLCRRQCDQAHDGDVLNDRIHRCEEGHQIQGFGGNRHKLNNRAITYGCHELNEQDKVLWQGNDINWNKFQTIIYKDRRWDLDDKNQGAKQLIKEKNMKMWNLIGPFICDYYRLEQQIDIQFIQADTDAKKIGSVLNTFYVLMLDNSSSMGLEDYNGQSRWINLISAVSQFTAIIEKDTLLKNNSKVSIITYNSTAYLEIESQIPSQTILSTFQDRKIGTQFNPPLIMAKDLMEKYKDNFDSFVLVMMSDGEGRYPIEGVEAIKKSPAKSKLKFKSIAYGTKSKNLARMALELGGTCEEVLEPNQLSNAFIQIIPNLYAQ